jgi:hypothetical protein
MSGTIAACWASRAEQRGALGHFPDDFRLGIGSGSQIPLNVFGIG